MVKRDTSSSRLEITPEIDVSTTFLPRNRPVMDIEKYHALIVENQDWALDIAYRKFLHWNIRNAKHEADDTVQQWNVELLSHPLRFDPGREFRPFAFRVLQRGCFVVLRREMKNRFVTAYEDPSHEKANWLEATVATQASQEMNQAIAQLPPKLRIAVERWFARCEASEPKSSATRRSGRQFNNYMFRARQTLKKIILAHEKNAGENKSLS